MIEFTREQRQEVDQARDAFHRAVMNALKEHNVDIYSIDLTEAGEEIALEGVLTDVDEPEQSATA
jgi:hypothetical protein